MVSAALCRSYSTPCKGSHTGATPFLTESMSQFIKCIQPTSRHWINDASHCSDKSNEESVWTHSLRVQSTSGGKERQSAVHTANVARKHYWLPPVYAVQGPNPQNRAFSCHLSLPAANDQIWKFQMCPDLTHPVTLTTNINHYRWDTSFMQINTGELNGNHYHKQLPQFRNADWPFSAI